MSKSKGQLLLDDFLKKSSIAFTIMREKGTITLDELTPAWDARAKLEAYLSPPRDDKGHFLSSKPMEEK